MEMVFYSLFEKEPDPGMFPLLSTVLKELEPGVIPALIPALSSTATDARVFSRLFIQTYRFTPMQVPKGSGLYDLAHRPNGRTPEEDVASEKQTLIFVIHHCCYVKEENLEGLLETGLMGRKLPGLSCPSSRTRKSWTGSCFPFTNLSSQNSARI